MVFNRNHAPGLFRRRDTRAELLQKPADGGGEVAAMALLDAGAQRVATNAACVMVDTLMGVAA
jgi:hypothetical protein